MSIESKRKRGSGWWLSRLFIVDFVGFVVLSQYFGGDAFNGKVEGDHFYLGQHGHFAEVGSAVFTYSQVHGVSVLLLFIASLAVDASKPGGIRFRFTEKERMRSVAMVFGAIAIVLTCNVVMSVFDLHYRY